MNPIDNDIQSGRKITIMEVGDPEIEIDVDNIKRVFVVLNKDDLQYQDDISGDLTKLIRSIQPRIWQMEFESQLVTISASAGENGYPLAESVSAALENIGLAQNETIVVNNAELSRGDKLFKLFLGFSYTDCDPKFLVPNIDALVPAKSN